MGYRSQVVIAFKREAFWKHVGEDIIHFKDCDQILQTEDSVTFLWESVKWEPLYADVQAVTRVVEKVASDESYTDDDHYGFLRLGEKEDDIERLGNPWNFDVYLYQHISVDDSADEIEHDKFFAPNSIKFIRGDDD